MESTRKILLIVAVACAALIVTTELGSNLFSGQALDREAVRRQLEANIEDPDGVDIDALVQTSLERGAPPGLALTSMALLDGLLLLNVGLFLLGSLVQDRVFAKVQGILTAVVSFLVLIAAFALALIDLGKVLVMVGLLLAVPFGTLAYLAIWGFFDTGSAAVALSVIFVLKLICVVTAALSQPQFLRMKGFILLSACALLANVVVSFLHGEFPLPLVSITDAIGAIVIAVLAIVWALLHFVGALSSVFKALKT